MNNRRNKMFKPSRIEQVDRKCELILSELAIIRRSLYVRSHSLDDAIERMHYNARKMRAEAYNDAKRLRTMFRSKTVD